MKIARSPKPSGGENVKGWLLYVSTLFAAVLTIGAFLALAPNAVNGYVDWRVEQKLSDPSFLSRVAQRVRPFFIFNAQGSIIYDSGATQYIDYDHKPRIDIGPLDKFGVPSQITIHFNQWFKYPPTLTVTSQGIYSCEAKQGSGYDWIYHIYAEHPLDDENSTAPASNVIEFKLEILY
jgi:hypothetical protein